MRGDMADRGSPMVICGDINMARTERDVHPKERKPARSASGRRARSARADHRPRRSGRRGPGAGPDNDGLFTWWAPWRNMRQRNIGWRIDYVLASQALFERAVSCTVQREFGTSDHGPVVAVFR